MLQIEREILLLRTIDLASRGDERAIRLLEKCPAGLKSLPMLEEYFAAHQPKRRFRRPPGEFRHRNIQICEDKLLKGVTYRELAERYHMDKRSIMRIVSDFGLYYARMKRLETQYEILLLAAKAMATQLQVQYGISLPQEVIQQLFESNPLSPYCRR